MNPMMNPFMMGNPFMNPFAMGSGFNPQSTSTANTNPIINPMMNPFLSMMGGNQYQQST